LFVLSERSNKNSPGAFAFGCRLLHPTRTTASYNQYFIMLFARSQGMNILYFH